MEVNNARLIIYQNSTLELLAVQIQKFSQQFLYLEEVPEVGKTLRYFETLDDAPSGGYRVTITWPCQEGHIYYLINEEQDQRWLVFKKELVDRLIA
jgi:hypothetical protein